MSELSRPFPNRDVLPAPAREWRAIPVTPTFPQMQSCDSGHEIELGGPDVAIRRVEDRDAITGDEIVVRYPLLGRDIDLVEAEVRRAHFEWQCQRVRRETLQVGNPQLDDQPASESEVPSRVPETL